MRADKTNKIFFKQNILFFVKLFGLTKFTCNYYKNYCLRKSNFLQIYISYNFIASCTVNKVQ